MAKITTLKYDLGGIQYNTPVNCNSGGQFICNIPAEVADAIGIERKIIEKTLDELESKFFKAMARFKESTVKEELFILIRYRSCGHYSMKKDGSALFYWNDSNYGLKIDSFQHVSSALSFEFHVAIKRTRDTNVQWFYARKGDNSAADNDPNKWYANGRCYHPETSVCIPFSEEAVVKLEEIREKIRSASEILFNFINQDQEKIQLTLLQNKLLG